jgi:lysophospholipase L1-like esterase
MMGKKLTLLYICLALILSSCSQFDNMQDGNVNKGKDTGIELKAALPSTFFPRDLHIVAAGDSLTQGVGDSTDSGGYIPYLIEQLEKEKTIRNANIDNFGVRGNRSDQLLTRLRSKELQSSLNEADLILLTIGGNDLMKVVKENFSSLRVNQFRTEQEVFKKRLEGIFKTIRDRNQAAPIILIGLYNPFYNWFADVKEMNQIVHEWNEQSQTIVLNDGNAYFVDIHDIFLNNEENLLYTDYFHPNDRGYELIADRVFEILDDDVVKSLGQ